MNNVQSATRIHVKIGDAAGTFLLPYALQYQSAQTADD